MSSVLGGAFGSVASVQTPVAILISQNPSTPDRRAVSALTERAAGTFAKQICHELQRLRSARIAATLTHATTVAARSQPTILQTNQNDQNDLS
jgi:hypothetical protein